MRHLDAEFAGRDDHEHLDAGRRVEADALDDREAEAEGLSGAGLRLADDVLAGESERDGLGLDGERFDDPFRRQSVDHVLVDRKVAECQVWPCLIYRGKPTV
ncbi:hypothetical protein GCM10025867_20870 [Frondihabitans sucicola]|uniref:Uncharacterized protein n=1 Tax=Frondihabitans sucicola TaxID=1268041 RepID=A0ABN6Y1K5_9MICO|nr:hypothetical protein GCM10025867_20870 [Frondihabitans sucicola]